MAVVYAQLKAEVCDQTGCTVVTDAQERRRRSSKGGLAAGVAKPLEVEAGR